MLRLISCRRNSEHPGDLLAHDGAGRAALGAVARAVRAIRGEVRASAGQHVGRPGGVGRGVRAGQQALLQLARGAALARGRAQLALYGRQLAGEAGRQHGLWMVLQDFLPIYFVNRMKRKSILFIGSRYNGTPLPDGMIQVGN